MVIIWDYVAPTPREEDFLMMLKCKTHLGTKNCEALMKPYVFTRRDDGKSQCACQHESLLTQ